MTPPDNTERPASSGTTDTDDANPPWQRVAKDDGTPAEQGEEFGDRWSAGKLPAEDGPQGQSHQVGGNADADTQFLPTGSANPVFGHETEGMRTQPVAAPSAGPHAAAHAASAEGRTEPVSALRRPGRGPRRASLQVKRFDPWSVLKLSLVLGVALFFVWLVAVGVLYTVLDGMGVWDKLNGTYSSLVQGDSPEGGEPLISVGRVFGVAAIVGAINIVLISALTTVSAFIYNVSADLSGGLEVTLSERE